MSERYTRVFALPENLYAEFSPVIISAGALLKDNVTGKVLVQLKIKNISDRIVKAVRIKINQFDVAGEAIDNEVNQEYLDLNVGRNSEFGQKTAITLPDSSTRSFSVVVTEVIFFDNDIWKADGAEWKSVIKPQTTYECFKDDSELMKQYKLDYNVTCKNMFAEDRDLWICSCGNINKSTYSECYGCGCLYETLKNFDMDTLVRNKNERVEKEKRAEEERRLTYEQKMEKAREEARKKAKRNKKIAITTTLIVCTVIVSLLAIIPAVRYNRAIALMEEEKYAEAIEVFEAMNSYKDSKEKADFIYDKIISQEIKNAKVGDDVFFGSYEQDNSLTNGSEKLRWLVLDKRDGKILLISKYTIDYKPYNSKNKSVTWDTCTLRNWLNSDFINAAFSDTEKLIIPTVTVDSDDHGQATQDKVFLLSETEAMNYFTSDSERQCEATNYAVAKGVYVSDDYYNKCNWTLRTMSAFGKYSYVFSQGNIATYTLCNPVYYEGGIRPAMWIDLNRE